MISTFGLGQSAENGCSKSRSWTRRGIIPAIAKEKGIELLEFEAIVDQVHLLLDVPEKATLPRTMMFLKGVSARRLFERFPELKLDAHTESFWQAGYGAKVVARSALPATAAYIQTQWDRLENYDRPSMPRGSARGTVPNLREGKQR